MKLALKTRSNSHIFVLLLSFTIFILILFTGCSTNKNVGGDDGEENPSISEENPINNDNDDSESTLDPEPEPEPEPETFTDITIAAAGDIMFHMSQINSGYDAATDSYDFKSFFEDVKPYFEAADLAIANYETTAAGSSRPYAGYPMFNAPDESIDAIKYAGIDVLTTVNNHSLDTGADGLKRTAKVIQEKGINTVGTYDSKPESRILMQDVKGIKIAILAYTESTNGLGAQYGETIHDMLNLMEEDRIKKDIQEAKEREADLIISFMHWGDEYAPNPNEQQEYFAHMMAEEGVDLILGSHPHVIQRSEFLDVGEQPTFVIYSMGNFISNQRRETLGAGFEPTEDGIIVNIDIQQNDQTKETVITNVDYIPTWVYRNKEQGQSTYTYRILPIQKFLDSDDMSTTYKERMQHALEATVSKMDTTTFKE